MTLQTNSFSRYGSSPKDPSCLMAPGQPRHHTPLRPTSLRWKPCSVACPLPSWQGPKIEPASLMTKVRNKHSQEDHAALTLVAGNLLRPPTFPSSPLDRICQNPEL